MSTLCSLGSENYLTGMLLFRCDLSLSPTGAVGSLVWQCSEVVEPLDVGSSVK